MEAENFTLSGSTTSINHMEAGDIGLLPRPAWAPWYGCFNWQPWGLQAPSFSYNFACI